METEFNPQQLIIPAVMLCAFAGAGLYFIYRQKQKGWIAELLVGLAAAGVGAFWGMGAQTLYTSGIEIPLFGNGVYNPEWIGAVAGGVLGLLAGMWFSRYTRGLFCRLAGAKLLTVSCLIGIALGMLCSTLVHIILMTAYRNLNFWPMLVGAGFGAASGLIVSLTLLESRKIGLIKIIEERV